MGLYIGLDLGTSSLKGLLVDREGHILREAAESYAVRYPQPGWSEQNPADWECAMGRVLHTLADDYAEEVRGIAVGGQMHGLVALDAEGRVIRPCILWNDGRTEKQTAWLNETIGRARLSALTGNIAFAGFTLPKLLWLRENEPENYARIARVMLPKDYLVYQLTGKLSSDYSDASGTLLLDVEHRCWSAEMCRICGISEEWLPPLHESFAPIGLALPRFNLPQATVCAGAGDNAAAAVGTGTVEDGTCSISLGTSGTLFLPEDRFSVDPENALHSFAHANGRYHRMGCILSAASCRRWWLEEVLGTDDYAADEARIAAVDTGDVVFLPYLMGERCPYNDTSLRGAFLGLSADTTRAQMSCAVMEGVAFALRDCLAVAQADGVTLSAATLCGGGAKSLAWRQILSDVLELPVALPETEQGPSFGAAMLAMVGCGEYPTVEVAARRIVRKSVVAGPQPQRVAQYAERYARYRKFGQRLYSLTPIG